MFLSYSALSDGYGTSRWWLGGVVKVYLSLEHYYAFAVDTFIGSSKTTLRTHSGCCRICRPRVWVGERKSGSVLLRLLKPQKSSPQCPRLRLLSPRVPTCLHLRYQRPAVRVPSRSRRLLRRVPPSMPYNSSDARMWRAYRIGRKRPRGPLAAEHRQSYTRLRGATLSLHGDRRR